MLRRLLKLRVCALVFFSWVAFAFITLYLETSHLLHCKCPERRDDSEAKAADKKPHIDIIRKDGPGENGRPVIIDTSTLTEIQQKRFQRGLDIHHFNEYASDLISLNRSIPNFRAKECDAIKYPADLPETSIVIIFRNEAWSTLLRTVHSILNRSPPKLIREIILVDDGSDLYHLGKPLDDYMANLPKIRISRFPKHEGSIRARNHGIHIARAEIVTFMDSHCEANNGWLEPLLARVHECRTCVPNPSIDGIDYNTFEYLPSIRGLVGNFLWNMDFSWAVIKRVSSLPETVPKRTPTSGGGIFSINKSFFFDIGGYDTDMNSWGADNLELSFHIWMCGGTLELLECSRVGHVYRMTTPFKHPNFEREIYRNRRRVARVWLDDYAEFFDINTKLMRPEATAGDVTGRINLRKRLKCHSFHWYIKNIYPELLTPATITHAGQVRNPATNLCFDSEFVEIIVPVKLKMCMAESAAQVWIFMMDGKVSVAPKSVTCLFSESDERPTQVPCDTSKNVQQWTYTKEKQIRHLITNKCVEVFENVLKMAQCKPSPEQTWEIPEKRISFRRGKEWEEGA